MGVVMLDLTQADPAHDNLFLPERGNLGDLTAKIDRINGRFAMRTIVHGAEGTRREHDRETGHDLTTRRQVRSPAYMTRWEDDFTIKGRCPPLLRLPLPPR